MWCFHRYCEIRGLQHPEIESLENDLWEFPVLASGRWHEWEDHHPPLVYSALGEEWPEGFAAYLAEQHLEPDEFRQLLGSVVEIVFSSFYGAAEDEPSMCDLIRVLQITAQAGVMPPPPTHFLESLFRDGGWGLKITKETRDKWRYGAC